MVICVVHEGVMVRLCCHGWLKGKMGFGGGVKKFHS